MEDSKLRRGKLKTVLRKILIGFVIISVVGLIVIFSAMMGLENRTKTIHDDYSRVFSAEKYQKAVFIDNIEVITQSISCGYATIEMFSAWNGGNLTEEALFEQYGRVVTSTGKSFTAEMNKQFPEFNTTMVTYLPNTLLIDVVYDRLSAGFPIPFVWAAKHNEVWTLHYSLVTGLDIPMDKIQVANPYGYMETLTLSEFLERTSFEAFQNMPLYYKLGFAFGVFDKNTIFVVE